MRPALVLFGYAALLALAAPPLLSRADWPQRAPRLGVLAWQALAVSALLAVVLAGLALAVPAGRLGADLGALLRACAQALRAQYAVPGGTSQGVIGLALVAAVSGRLLYAAVIGVGRGRRQRRAHRCALTLVANPDPQLDALIVENDTAAAYCLPGSGGRVVLTTRTVAALDPAQLAAVLAHERAHLRGRHHWLLTSAAVLVRAFPRVRLFRVAAEEMARLMEMVADDAAGRCHRRLDIAGALVILAGAAAPSGGLAAGGPSTPARVHRLLQPPRPLPAPVTAAGLVLVALTIAAPLLLAAGPAIAAAHTSFCLTPAG